MPGLFIDLEVRDPRLIAPISWDYLPRQEKVVVDRGKLISSREWEPLDQRRFRIEPNSYRTQYSIGNIGRLHAHRIADSLAMQFTIRLPTRRYRIVVFERGGARFFLLGADEPVFTPRSALPIVSRFPRDHEQRQQTAHAYAAGPTSPPETGSPGGRCPVGVVAHELLAPR